MSYSPAMCPNCKKIILVNGKTPFLVCPQCAESASTGECVMLLDAVAAAPNKMRDMIELCIELEKLHGGELPLQVLFKLAENHPHNEEIAWLIVRMSDFNPINVHKYLTTFSVTQNTVPWAEDFLDGALCYRNMQWYNFFEQYIANKLAKNQQKEWQQKFNDLKTRYTARSSESDGLAFLYVYYVAGAVLNAALTAMFIFTKWHFFVYTLIAVVAFAVEVFVLFIHFKQHGNRITMSNRERLFLVIFLCSIALLGGGVFLGAVVKL